VLHANGGTCSKHVGDMQELMQYLIDRHTTFECPNCLAKTHQCFSCKREGTEGKDVIKWVSCQALKTSFKCVPVFLAVRKVPCKGDEHAPAKGNVNVIMPCHWLVGFDELTDTFRAYSY